MGEKRTIGARHVALRVLCAIETRGAYVHIALDRELQRSSLDRRDRRLATELVYGTLRRRFTLDWVLTQFSRYALQKMSVPLRNNLRMALYQMMFLDSIPPAVACNEAVELAKISGHKGTVSLVNGILRAVLRERDRADYVAAAKKLKKEEAISLLHSHPLWLVKTWIEQLGFDKTEKLCAANNLSPSTHIRTNTLKTTQKDLFRGLESQGFSVSKGLLAPEAIRVSDSSGIADSSIFEAGHFAFQDEAAMLVAHAVSPQGRGLVYDLCAGLGGKTLHLAALMENAGQIIAFDIHPGKLKVVTSTARRVGATNVKTAQADIAHLSEEYFGKADGVLLDAPCSGWGVVRRKPDIRWRISEEEVGSLVRLQRQLLKNAYRCLAPGGRLVYSTCTINRAENEDNVLWVQANHPDLRLIQANEWLPKQVPPGYEHTQGLQLLPHQYGTDGFFIAVLERSS